MHDLQRSLAALTPGPRTTARLDADIADCKYVSEFRIYFDADEDLDISGQLKTAQTLLDGEQDRQRKIEAFAVKEMLSVANDWRDGVN